MLCRAAQDEPIMVESFAKVWSTGEGNGKPLQYSCLENPMNYMKRQKYMTLKMNSPGRKCPRCYWRRMKNNCRKNEEMEPKQKQFLVVDVTDDGSKVWCYKEQYFIGTWNVRFMNQVNWKWSNRRWQE